MKSLYSIGLPVYLLGVLLWSYTTSVAQPVVEPTVFERVCEALESDCAGIDLPIPVYSQLVDDMPCIDCTYNGLTYPGEPYIFINSFTSEEQQQWTEFHETVHYTTYQLGISGTRCEDEDLARRLTALEFDYEYDPAWMEGYRCNADGTDVKLTVFPEEILEIINRIKGN